MKILVFSDTHLTHKFDEKKYKFLHKIISDSDRVIINGDFWDGYLTTFNKFIHSSWKKLFPLLKSKKTVYIYGNHDIHAYSNKNSGQFSVKQTYEYRLTVNNKTFVFEHGHRLLKLLDQRLSNRTQRGLLSRVAGVVGLVLRRVAIEDKLYKLGWLRLKQNSLKERRKDTKSHQVFGHVHYAEADHINKLYSSGTLQHGRGQYLTIDDTGAITLHEEKY